MKKSLGYIVAWCLAILLLTCSVFAVSPFPDVDETAEYADAVEYLSEVSIMCGDDKGNFNPDKTVTRAEMATIICNMLGETDNVTKTGEIFSDVPESHWASGYIAKAISLKIISGYGDGRFGPDDTVTFEQAVTMIVQAMELADIAITAGGYPDGYISVAEEYGLRNRLSVQKGTPMLRWQISILVYNTRV